MIKSYTVEGDRLKPMASLEDDPAAAVWIDLMEPTKDEEKDIERLVGINVPTREEMEEIEISSRLYSEHGAYFMTATLPAHIEGSDPVVMPVTFVLAGDKLITVRYHEPRAFKSFPMRAEKTDIRCIDGTTVMVALLETLVDRLADLLERISHNVLELSHDIFLSREKNASKRDLTFQAILRAIGRKEDIISDMQESLLSLERLAGYLGHMTLQKKGDKDIRERVKTIARDVSSLVSHTAALSQKINFLLDATLGMISIEQNAIIKIFSVAAVIFLPPTLVASIYGMNFKLMPELDWEYGYPLAICLMIAAAVVPYLYFKRRGWL